jgi:arabinofuranosyltransferase
MKLDLPPFTRIEKIALGLGLALAIAMMWPIRNYVTDDTFFHLQYARHLAGGQGLVFNPHERVYGCTSPLWVALLAGGIELGLDGLLVSKLLGVLAALASLGLFLRLMRRTVATPALRAAATVAWASHPWMAQWSTSGMETSLAVALTLAGFVAFTEGRRWGARPVRTGALWALATLTRPEAGLLLLLWGAFLLIETENRFGLRRLIAGALPPFVIVGAWLLFARIYFGTFWPQTLAAQAAGSTSSALHLDSVWRQARLLGSTDGILLILLGISLAFGGLRGISPASAAQRWLPWAWLAALPALYVARGMSVLTRSLLTLLPVLAWLAWRAAEAWWLGPAPTSARSRRAGWFAAVVAVAVIAQNLAVHQRTVVPHVRAFTPALTESLVKWGRWFDRHSAPSTVIATRDIGAIGYYGRRRVVDLAGLVTPAMVPLLARERPEVAIAAFRFASFSRPEFLVDRAAEPYELKRHSRYASCLVPLGHESVPDLDVSRTDPVIYSFYRLDWAAFDSLHAEPAR